MKRFFSQFRNYMAGITVLLKDLFAFSPVSVIKVLGFSTLGTSLQAMALGATFFILRHLKNGLHINVSKLVPLIDVKVHVTILFVGVLMLLGLAVLLLYLAERAAFQLSRRYADNCTMELVDTFAVIASAKKNPVISSRNGLPVTFAPELKKRGMILEIAVRNLIRAPQSFLQLMYATGFLLFLEPRLTIVLLVVVVPLLIPLNRLTRTMKNAEKKRQEVMADMRADAERLARESGRLMAGFQPASPHCRGMFETTAYAMSNYYRYLRVSGQAGARAIAGAGLVITGVVCIVYFGLFFSGRALPVALIVVYAGALRMAAMSGRQSVSRIAAYARFYDRVQDFFNDRARAVTPGDRPDIPKNLGIQGVDLSENGEQMTTVKGNGPFAVMGTFPLLPLNRYAFASLLPRLNRRKRQFIVANMAVLSDVPSFTGQPLTWREFLGVTPDKAEKAKRDIQTACFLLNGQKIADQMEAPVPAVGEKAPLLTTSQAIEAVLLRACLQEAPVIIIKDEVLGRMDAKAVAHWKERLRDRLLLIYYSYEAPLFGRWGEVHAALVPNAPEKPGGVASVTWIKENADQVKIFLKGERAEGEWLSDDGDWDDDDDDE